MTLCKHSLLHNDYSSKKFTDLISCWELSQKTDSRAWLRQPTDSQSYGLKSSLGFMSSALISMRSL